MASHLPQAPTPSAGISILLYGLAFGLAGVTPLALLPFLTHHLEIATFGQITAFLTLVPLLAGLSGLSIHGFLTVRYFKTSTNDLGEAIGSAIYLLIAIHLLLAIVVQAAHPYLIPMADLSISALMLMVGAALILNLNLLGLALFQVRNQPFRYLKAKLIQTTLEIGLCIATVMWISSEAWTRTSTFTIAVACSALFGLVHSGARLRIPARTQWRWAREIVGFGAPLTPHILSGLLLVSIDRVMVSNISGAASLGLYMVSLQIAMIFSLLTESLSKALTPKLLNSLKSNDPVINSKIVSMTYRIFGCLCAAGIILWCVATLIFPIVIDPQYAAAKSLLPWFIAGFVAQGFYYAVVNYLFAAERTSLLSAVSTSLAIIGACVSYTLTTRYGLEGAAASFAINNLLYFLATWIAAAKVYSMPWLASKSDPRPGAS